MKLSIVLLSAHLLLGIAGNTKVLESLNNIDPVKAFPGAEGFGQFAQGARGYHTPSLYVVSNLDDNGPGSFRDAVSKPGRFVIFETSGIIKLQSNITVAPYTTIAGQTASGQGITLYGRKVSFTGANHSIIRYIRIRLGADVGATRNDDASGIANGKHIIFDHVSFSWGQDEVFSINWDRRGFEPDSITLQHCIISQGLNIHNHSAGGLIQTMNGHVSILKSLYASNKTRNPKVKSYNEFVNNVVYNWGNAGNTYGHSVSGDGYIMGGSAGVSKVNIINNYFIAGPATPPRESPLSRGTGTFYLYAAGNYYDDNKDGTLNGSLLNTDSIGYPGLSDSNFARDPFSYPFSSNIDSASEAFEHVIRQVGAVLPSRDDVDHLILSEVASKGKKGTLIFRETDLPLPNGGLGVFKTGQPLKDTDQDGIPDAVEQKMGLNPLNASDALQKSKTHKGYYNIEVYINGLAATKL